MFRDPRYLVPAAVLVGVIFVSVAAGGGTRDDRRDGIAPTPSPTSDVRGGIAIIDDRGPLPER
jgi:hypothetical protein